jgi:hypothetical protein
VSDHEGVGFLAPPRDFSLNKGGSSLADRGIPVALTTLDAAIPQQAVSLLKIDIEGHELAALNGGERTLAETRHVVFEERDRLPTPVTDNLRSAGFRLYGIAETWRGPRLIDPEQLVFEAQWDAPNYLATRDPCVRRLVRPDGWRCLRPSSDAPLSRALHQLRLARPGD